MKNQFFFTLAAIVVVMFLVSFQQTSSCGNAVAEKINGIDVYVFSKPTREYEVIKSSISNGLIFDNGEGVVSRSAKKAYIEKGDGVIVHLSNSRYEIIKYK